MRIIAGIHRSRKILPPEDERTTRPITDRVKQALFDRLANMGMLEGGCCVDIFAGTGSLGLEALSRGVEHCTFVERDKSARQRLEQNIDALRVRDESLVLAVDALSAGYLHTLPRTPVDIFFCDPPYAMMEDAKTLPRVVNLIAAMRPVSADWGIVMLRTAGHVDAPLVTGWKPANTYGFGSMSIHLYDPAPVDSVDGNDKARMTNDE